MKATSIPAGPPGTGSATGTAKDPAHPSAPARPGVTERLASASAHRPWLTVTAWGVAVVIALVLAVTGLHGLTSSAHVIGATESSQAEALYDQALGQAAAQRPTDVIVVSSPGITAGDPGFRAAVSQLAARVAAMPGVTSVRFDLAPGSPLVSATRHAALIDLRATTDSDIKPVVQAVRAANGRDGVLSGRHR